MYDRATRQLFFQTGCTPSDVGPGAYDVTKERKRKVSKGAPFLANSSRKACDQVVHDDLEFTTPGPAYYDAASLNPRVVGGTSLTSTEVRFKQKVSNIPGPAWYNVKRYREGRGERPRGTRVLLQDAVASIPGKLLPSRLQYRKRTDGPSIPTRGMSFGFLEQRDGTLRRLRAPSRDSTIGPAYYGPPVDETRVSRQYRGVHFGKMASRKTDSVLDRRSEAPGPGTYNLRGTGAGGIGDALKMQQAEKDLVVVRPETNIPRYNEAILRETQKQNIPGPGVYEIRSQFEPQSSRFVSFEGLMVERPPFNSQAKRFSSVPNSVPAPGTYNDPRSALDRLKRLSGLTRSPFGQTSVRFRRQTRAKGNPGPGTYSSLGMGMVSMVRALRGSTRRGVFGTSATRDFPLSHQPQDLPSPAHYQVKERTFQQYAEKPSANFHSLTDRIAEPSSLIKDNPAPGSYDVSKSYDRSQVHLARTVPRTLEAFVKHTTFNTFAPRFQQSFQRMKTPGPGTYECQQEGMQDKGGLLVSRDTRFRHTVEAVPGPGTYVFPPTVQDTVLRGTFNATLSNPVGSLAYPAVPYPSPSPTWALARPRPLPVMNRAPPRPSPEFGAMALQKVL